MRDENFIVTHDGADGRARGQLNFADTSPHDFRALSIAVCDGFDRLGSASPEAMYSSNIRPAYIGQQRANRGLLRGYGDIDLATLYEVNIGRFAYQGDHLADSQALCHKRGHHINFVIICNGAKRVALIDVFLE